MNMKSYTKRYRGSCHIELDEFEYLDDYYFISFDVEYIISPEEPMVKYYQDGSGYPGSPMEIEIFNPYNIKISGSEGIVTNEVFNSWNILDVCRDYIEEQIFTRGTHCD